MGVRFGTLLGAQILHKRPEVDMRDYRAYRRNTVNQSDDD